MTEAVAEQAPSQPTPGLTLERLKDILRTTGADLEPQRMRALKGVLYSSSSVNDCLVLHGDAQWRSFVQLAVVMCVSNMDPAGVRRAVWALEASTQEFKTALAAELQALWPGLVERLAPSVVTHVSKNVHTAVDNDVFLKTVPSVVAQGVLASGDVLQHRYATGSANKFAGKRHLFDAAAWRDGEWVQLVDELADPGSPTGQVLLELGAGPDVLEQLAAFFSRDRLPACLHQQLRQVFVRDSEGQDLLLTPLPSVAMAAYLACLRAPHGFWLDKEYQRVGGTQPGNVSGQALGLGGQIPLLSARLPRLHTAQAAVFRRVFYPRSLLARLSWPDVQFLLVGHSAWNNSQRRAYCVSRADELLNKVAAPWIQLLDAHRSNPRVLRQSPYAEALSQTTNPMLQRLLGASSQDVVEGCKDLIWKRIRAALGDKIPTQMTVDILDGCIEAFVEAA